MPTIKRLNNQKKKSTNHSETESRKLRREAYNNTAWRKLRDNFIALHPLCEDCLSKGIVKPAHDIHHLRSPFVGGEINYALLLDENNLVSLCQECHALRHQQERGYKDPQVILDALEELFNEI